MFSILIEEVFQIRNRRGITLIGKASGIISIGDYLFDSDNRNNCYSIIGIEMVHYSSIEKNLTYNPAIIIEPGDYEPSRLIGKTLEAQ
ncbi:MAG: hypothetical protein ACM3X7_00440 [Solirubrobacterales bacterium]